MASSADISVYQEVHISVILHIHDANTVIQEVSPEMIVFFGKIGENTGQISLTAQSIKRIALRKGIKTLCIGVS